MLAFSDARRKVIEVVTEILRDRAAAPREHVALSESLGRVLATPINAHRDYPPFKRSTRDGYAVCAVDLRESGATLTLVGEIAAGKEFSRAIQPGECVQIMTGAAPPEGADAVEMIEYTRAEQGGTVTRIHFSRTAKP